MQWCYEDGNGHAVWTAIALCGAAQALGATPDSQIARACVPDRQLIAIPPPVIVEFRDMMNVAFPVSHYELEEVDLRQFRADGTWVRLGYSRATDTVLVWPERIGQ